MASDLEELEILCRETGLSKAAICNVLNSSESAKSIFKDISEYVSREKAQKEKMINNVQILRRARVNADQQFNQLEKQLISCNSKLEHETQSNEILKKNLDETAEALEVKSKRLSEAESLKDAAVTNYSTVFCENQTLEAEKLTLVATLERKNQEIDRLNEEWKLMSEKVSNANAIQYEAKAKLDELKSKETSYQLREKRLEQEKDLVTKQRDWFDSLLKKKSEEYFLLRKEQTSTITQLQTSLDAKIDEANNLESLSENLKTDNEELKDKTSSLVDKLKEAREHHLKTEEQYKLEIASQSKLALLYKDTSESSKLKCEELVGAIEELQGLLKEANNGRVEVESKLTESEGNLDRVIKEYDEKVMNIENELKNANDLLEAARQRGTAPMSAESLAAFSPTAAATSSFLKSGMTLTQIYNQYVETLDSLEIEKAENGRLKGYLEDILKDIEEKAPLLQQQRKDYEGSLITIDKLTLKLEDAMKEMEKYSMETSEAVQKSEHLRRENERMKVLTADLASQVKVLLKECEEARGSVVSTTSSIVLDDLAHSHDEVSSSSEVISSRLVTFRNIEELQEQNQRLLTVVRELSEEKEKDEQKEKSDLAHTELKQKLDEALNELEELKESRERQTSMVEAVVRQRDMYRVLLANTGQSPITPRQVLDQNVLNQSSFEETNEALKELQKQFESYKNEKLSNEKQIKEKNEELRSTISELNIKNATAMSQLEHTNERYKLLESNCNSLKREAAALRDKSEKLSLTSAKLETSYETAKQDLSEVKEKLMRSEVMYQNLVEEKNIVKQAEARLVEENKSLINQQKGQNTLLTNLQTIQNNLERQEYETRSRHTSQVSALEQEVAILKQKLTSEQDQITKSADSFKSQVGECKRKLKAESELLKEAENKVEALQLELNSVKIKLSEKESHLLASETRLNEILARDASEDGPGHEFARRLKEKEEQFSSTVEEIKGKLYETETRNKVLENQIGLSKKHLDQYKAMLTANEEALSELNKTSKLYQEKAEGEKEDNVKVMAALQESLTSTQATLANLTSENTELKKQFTDKTASLQKSVEILTSEAREAVKRAEMCVEKEKRANEICEEQKTLAKETQEKYQKELVHHASDVQALTLAKEQLETFESRLAETEEKRKNAEGNLNECKASWEEQKNIHKGELEKLVSRCDELKNQNALLHEQGEKLSQQVLAAQSRSLGDIRVTSETTPESSDAPVDKTVKDLWEVIRFVRKEKEIAETKSELLQSESVRYQQRLEYVEKQLQDTEEILKKEKERTKSLPIDVAEHEEIMKKVEMVAEIEEMNKVLNNDKETLQNKLKQTEAQAKRLESDINPLKQSIKNLTAQKDMLVGEKTGLRSEIQRWRSRVNQLIEQCKNQIDPEEMKKLQEEKKQLVGQQKASTDEAQKLKVRMDAMRNEITRLQAEINVKKTETAKIQEELKTAKAENNAAAAKLKEENENFQKELGTKTDEIQEKAKTIIQLKKIAKRYKTQYDETFAQKEELSKKLSEEQPSGDVTKQENMITTLTEEKNSLQEEMDKLNQNLKTSKEKEEKSKKTLNSATKRIQQLMTMKDKYSAECEELKKSLEGLRQEKEALAAASSEREMRLTVLSTQFEGKHARMDKELKEKNELIEKYEQEKNESQEKENEKESEIDKLKKKLQQYDRLIRQAQQKIKSQASQIAASQGQGNSSSSTVSSGGNEDLNSTQVTTAVPPTAAVKPTATPTNSVPVRSLATPTASIRPMTSATVQATPRATVPPTVTTQPAVPTAVTTQPTVSAEPIATLPVSARAQTSATPTVHPLPSTPVSSSVMTSTTSDVAAVSVRPIMSSSVAIIPTHDVDEERPSDVIIDERPSTSAQIQSAELRPEDDVPVREDDERPGNKRPRESESTTDQNLGLQEAKKSRTEMQEEIEETTEQLDEEDVLDVMAEDDNIDVDDNDEERQEEVEEEREVVCIDDDSEEEEAGEDDGQIEADDIDEDDDVVEVIDDDDDEDDDEDDVENDVEDDIDMKEFADAEEIPAEQSQGPGQEESADSTDVVIPTTTDAISTSHQEQHSQEPVVTSQSVHPRTQPPFIRSQSHLAPFTLSQSQSGGGGFDETDDCMVPSTPTLFIPKRSDGFSEMISSPRVQHPSFLFGSTTESSLPQTGGLAMGMTEEGLRVDDTRFDIMASSGEGDEADLGFDNVVPDLDEAATIDFTSEDDILDPPTMVDIAASGVDVSEQNVPETSEKFDPVEVTEAVPETSKAPDENVTSQLEQKAEVKDSEEASGSSLVSATTIKPAEERLVSFADSSKEMDSQESSSTSEPSTSTGKTIVLLTSQENRPSQKSTVVQLRRPGQPQTQASRGRRQIRRVQGLGQAIPPTRGLQRRGRGQWPGNQ
ncbi:nucleoprotein TPR-like isoform X2 [Dendronephthya gigantea]|uniref:nucleoprotein TPR-like isoform X2 n=1 Tax=Dendronephthya gigantea TaxID=151771 RepID=UPI00106D2742|nr:nucleoprotein TPR-like isoform X2 [Dendronephthya gigantea]